MATKEQEELPLSGVSQVLAKRLTTS